MAQSAVKLEPIYLYGFTSGIKGGAHFVNDETIVYPVGRVLTFHKIDKNTQQYVKVKGNYKINAITVSPNRKVLAVAIVGPKPVISFYDTTTLKRLMTVGNLAEGFRVKLFEHIAFTQDSVYLTAVTSEPESLLVYYKWESGGVVAHTKADGKPAAISSSITALAPHPIDSSILAIGGIGIFRLVTLYYNEWRQFGFKRAEYWPISGLCWITPELVLVGTKDGRLMVIEESLMKGEFRVQDLSEIRVSNKDDLRDVRKATTLDTDSYRNNKEPSLEVQGLEAFSQGFVYAYNSYEVCVFQKVDKRHWVKKNVIITGAPVLWEEQMSTVNFIRHINISPSENKIVCTSGSSDIYYCTIFQEQDSKFKNKVFFELIHSGYHFGSVATISTCLFKPLFLSVGLTDRTCRIWNFETLKMVNSQSFLEDIVTAAFHPSGWYCSIAFEKNIQVFMILMVGMKPIALFNVANCQEIHYSKRGSMLACTNGLLIDIYATTTFEKLWEIPVKGPVSSLHFSAHDFVLFTATFSGVIQKYCLKTGRKIFGLEKKSGVVHSLTSSRDGEMLYVVGADGRLNVYNTLKESNGSGEIANHFLNQSVLNAITMVSDNSIVLIGGQSMAICSVQLPIEQTNFKMDTFKMHSNAVIKLEVSQVNPTLISLGRDGVIGIWNLVNLPKKPRFLKYYREVDEVIVNAENWSNKKYIIKEQQEIMNRMDIEYDNTLKSIETDRTEQEAKIAGRYQGVLDIIGLNNKITQGKNAAEVEKMALKKQNMIHNFDNELDEQRVVFEQRLRSEQDDLEQWRCGWDNIKYNFDQLINSVKMAGQCVSKRLEYFSALELTRRSNHTMLLKDEIMQIIEEQKLRELNLFKHSQFELDELIEDSERHEQLAVQIIQLRSQKQKLCAQVEGLESTYYNMQEFLRETHKTITGLDRRKSQKIAVDIKQKKIAEILQGLKDTGRDILDNIEVSKAFHMHHMVSEECIEGLCQINHLLEERKLLKRKEQWLRKELVDSTRLLNKLRYVLSFLSLQSYLHDNALQKNILREKDRNRKMHFFRTNLKKEIHSIMCSSEPGNLKGRIINLYSQYADPKVDYYELLDQLPGSKELWKAINHLEATKLHFGKCVRRMKLTKREKSCEALMSDYVKAYDDDVDLGGNSSSSEGFETSVSRISKDKSKIFSKQIPKREAVDQKVDKVVCKKKPHEVDKFNQESSTSDRYNTSDEEFSSSCGSTIDDNDEQSSVKTDIKDPKPSMRKTPLSVLISKCKTEKTRAAMYSDLHDEKKLIMTRLYDVRKWTGSKKKTNKDNRKESEMSERANYKKTYSKIPMKIIIKALNAEINQLSKAPVLKQLAEEESIRPEETVVEAGPSSGHLCSLCKSFDKFTKYFEQDGSAKPTRVVKKPKL